MEGHLVDSETKVRAAALGAAGVRIYREFGAHWRVADREDVRVVLEMLHSGRPFRS